MARGLRARICTCANVGSLCVNSLTLEQVRAVEEGRPVAARAKREVLNYFATLRFVEKNADRKALSHEDIFRLHKIIAGEVMDQGSGRYRIIAIRVGRHVPPLPVDVSGLIDFLHLSDNSHVFPRYASERENR